MEEGRAPLSSILTWRIPWTEEPGGLQSIGSRRVGHDLCDLAHTGKGVLLGGEEESLRFELSLLPEARVG